MGHTDVEVDGRRELLDTARGAGLAPQGTVSLLVTMRQAGEKEQQR